MKPLALTAAVALFVAFLLLVPQSVVGVTGVVVGGGAFALLLLREVRLYRRVRRITSNPRPGFIDTGNFRYSREKDRL